MRKGIFITLEGGEGCGKTTQVELLKKYFNENVKQKYIFTREPGGTMLGEKIRELLLNDTSVEISGRAEVMLFLSSRAQLYEQVIKPALDNDEIVIADRFYDSNVVYQGNARGAMPMEAVLSLNKQVLDGLTPDLTFYLKISPEEAFSRKKEQKLDKLETAGMEFHRRVYEGYNWLAKHESQRFCVIDATQSVELVHKTIIDRIESLIEKHYN